MRPSVHAHTHVHTRTRVERRQQTALPDNSSGEVGQSKAVYSHYIETRQRREGEGDLLGYRVSWVSVRGLEVRDHVCLYLCDYVVARRQAIGCF